LPGASQNILVVGAGPTGLTAAVELARHGVAARIIDRDPAPTALSKAAGISARTLDILEPSGVAERLLAEGIRIRHGHVRFEGRKLGTIDFSTLPHRYNFLLALPQSATERNLADMLREGGISVEWNTALTGLSQAGGQVEVQLEGPDGAQQARYNHVFGADGVHSAVREAAGLAFEGYIHSRTWSIADAALADWPYEPDAAHLFFHHGGDLGFIIPIGAAEFRAVSNTPDALAQVPGDHRIATRLRADTFHIPVKQAQSYQAGAVFLGGDAAHVHSPVGARGMNLGIEDGAAFARRLVADRLDGYTAERRPVGRRWIRLSERILAAAQMSNPSAIALRNLAIRIVGKLPPLQRPMLMRMAGLKE
jgi:2-polyprenyl-6-methoxyphenol hydroxylase-like FAD-dependent oxidoreductase